MLFSVACVTTNVLPPPPAPVVATDTANTVTPTVLDDDKPADSLLQVIRTKQLQFKYFSAKVDVDANLDKSNPNFACKLAIVKDSAIWLSIGALGIEAYRVLITKDSVYFLDRLKKLYFKGGFGIINNVLKIDADYQMVQSILLGTTYLYYKENNYLTSRDEDQLLFSSLPKRKLKRAIRGEENTFLLVHANWVDEVSCMVKKLFIKDFKHNRKLEVNYSNLASVDSQPVYSNIAVNIKADGDGNINLKFNNIKINKPVAVPFIIPSGYSPVDTDKN